MITWVIGSGGLLGSAFNRIVDRSFAGSQIPWDNSESALHVLSSDLDRFFALAPERWSIIWAAGYATTASSQEEADRELLLFQQFVRQLASRNPSGDGVFLFASSAGGVYAGSSDPPFDSRSAEVPIGVYGRLKLAQEEAATNALQGMCAVVIARISNLYGPGQNLFKLQGIISRLAYSAVSKDLLSVFVPLDTLRDYIYVDDAAMDAMSWVEDAFESPNDAHIRVIASGESVGVGYVIALMQDVARVNIPITYGVHDSARSQAPDLRLVPDYNATITSRSKVTLPVGMKRVYQDILQRHADARLLD